MDNFRSILVFVAILSFLLAAGCGNDDDNPTDPGNNVPAELVGTWLYQSATLNGTPWSLASILEWGPETVAARFTVGADGSLINEELDADSTVIWSEWGTFTVSGNTATLTITENDDGPLPEPSIISGTWSLNGDILTLTTVWQGATIVLTAIRYHSSRIADNFIK